MVANGSARAARQKRDAAARREGSLWRTLMPIYALNLFDVSDRDEYLAYSRRSAAEVEAHGGRVVALGKFRESIAGDVAPRTVLILVEWTSKEAFDGYCNDPVLTDLHPHRVKGTRNYLWHLFDKLDDLRPVLKASS